MRCANWGAHAEYAYCSTTTGQFSAIAPGIGIAKSWLGITNIGSAGQSYQRACNHRDRPGGLMMRAGHVCGILERVLCSRKVVPHSCVVQTTERDAIASTRVIGEADNWIQEVGLGGGE
jgi:hypothetical protein